MNAKVSETVLLLSSGTDDTVTASEVRLSTKYTDDRNVKVVKL
jgi:hypothetical protein